MEEKDEQMLEIFENFPLLLVDQGRSIGTSIEKIWAFKKAKTPLSPFIFSLVVDCLIQMVDRARERHLIEGLTVGREEVEISHLQFTHDTNFFLSKGNQILANLSTVIESFCG